MLVFFTNTVSEIALTAPVNIGGNTLCAYVVAKLADLHPVPYAKAFGLWAAVDTIFLAIGTSLGKSPTQQNRMKAVFLSASTVVALRVFWKQNFLGEKMLLCILLVRALVIMSFLSTAGSRGEKAG